MVKLFYFLAGIYILYGINTPVFGLTDEEAAHDCVYQFYRERLNSSTLIRKVESGYRGLQQKIRAKRAEFEVKERELGLLSLDTQRRDLSKRRYELEKRIRTLRNGMNLDELDAKRSEIQKKLSDDAVISVEVGGFFAGKDIVSVERECVSGADRIDRYMELKDKRIALKKSNEKSVEQLTVVMRNIDRLQERAQVLGVAIEPFELTVEPQPKIVDEFPAAVVDPDAPKAHDYSIEELEHEIKFGKHTRLLIEIYQSMLDYKKQELRMGQPERETEPLVLPAVPPVQEAQPIAPAVSVAPVVQEPVPVIPAKQEEPPLAQPVPTEIPDESLEDPEMQMVPATREVVEDELF